MSSAAEKIVAEALCEADRRRLHAAIARSAAQFAAGEGVAAERVLADLEAALPAPPGLRRRPRARP